MSGGWTPAPWYIDAVAPLVSEAPALVVVTQDFVIAEVFADTDTNEPECAANARLIAAAPEMAEALRLVVGMADGDDAEFDADGEEIEPFELCRALLAKIAGAA